MLAIFFVGFFGLTATVRAQQEGVEQCYTSAGVAISLGTISTSEQCKPPNSWHGYTAPPQSVPDPATPEVQKKAPSDLYSKLPGCGILISGTLEGCLVAVFYWVLYALPSWLLWITAGLFNFSVSITLSSLLYKESTFIPEAWKIVRDFSNIFFICSLTFALLD